MNTENLTNSQKLQQAMELLKSINFEDLEATVASDESEITPEQDVIYDTNDKIVKKTQDFLDSFFFA